MDLQVRGVRHRDVRACDSLNRRVQVVKSLALVDSRSEFGSDATARPTLQRWVRVGPGGAGQGKAVVVWFGIDSKGWGVGWFRVVSSGLGWIQVIRVGWVRWGELVRGG